MWKKHKYKIIIVLILFVVAGAGTAYYFKKKEDEKKEAEQIDQANKTVEKEPLLASKPVTIPKEAPKKDTPLSKGEQQSKKA